MANRTARVCIVGSCNLDLTFRVPRLPRPGETLAAHALYQSFGGKGANQAVAAACLGAAVTLIARVGDDAFGRHMIENLRGRAIDATFIGTDTAYPTGTASIYVDDAGTNSIVIAAGANLHLTAADVRAAAEAIRNADVVACQLETPIAAAQEAFTIARAAGVRTILNPAPAGALPDTLLRSSDLCVPNETELELLTGESLVGPGALEAAATALRSRGPATVIVTLGAAGALLLDTAATHIPGWPVAAVDPTGAGDVFIGALVVALAEGASLPEAVERANAAAAISVTRPGTQSAAPTRTEVDAWLRERG